MSVNLSFFFFFFFDLLDNNGMLRVMSTHRIQFHNRIRKFPKLFVVLNFRKNFEMTLKRVRNNHGKRVIGVRAIEIRLYSIRKQ